MCDVSSIMSTAAVRSARICSRPDVQCTGQTCAPRDAQHADPFAVLMPCASCVRQSLDWQPLQLHDTEDLFPGVQPRGMGQPAAIPKKVADLTRFVDICRIRVRFARAHGRNGVFWASGHGGVQWWVGAGEAVSKPLPCAPSSGLFPRHGPCRRLA